MQNEGNLGMQGNTSAIFFHCYVTSVKSENFSNVLSKQTWFLNSALDVTDRKLFLF